MGGTETQILLPCGPQSPPVFAARYVQPSRVSTSSTHPLEPGRYAWTRSVSRVGARSTKRRGPRQVLETVDPVHRRVPTSCLVTVNSANRLSGLSRSEKDPLSSRSQLDTSHLHAPGLRGQPVRSWLSCNSSGPVLVIGRLGNPGYDHMSWREPPHSARTGLAATPDSHYAPLQQRNARTEPGSTPGRRLSRHFRTRGLRQGARRRTRASVGLSARDVR
jgi:hypothetical protein